MNKKIITSFYEFLNEIDFNIYPTKYVIDFFNFNNNNIEYYKFTSNSGIDYSVYFMITRENNCRFSDGTYLFDYIITNKIPTIFFGLSDKGLNDKSFDDLLNAKESLEVMCKVCFLINEYMNKHDYKVYSIGEVDDKKLKFYNYYKKHFSEYTMKIGDSINYKDDIGNYKKCYYLIK